MRSVDSRREIILAFLKTRGQATLGEVATHLEVSKQAALKHLEGLEAEVLLASDQEPHVTVIAILSTLVVALLFSPVKNRIQDVIDRLFFRERYSSRRALLRLSQDLNADLDLGRMAERLLEGVHAALGVNALALFLPEEDTGFAIFRDLGCAPAAREMGLPALGALVRALAAGEPVAAEAHAELYPEAGPLDLSHYFPCRVKGELIAVLGVGR